MWHSLSRLTPVALTSYFLCWFSVSGTFSPLLPAIWTLSEFFLIWNDGLWHPLSLPKLNRTLFFFLFPFSIRAFWHYFSVQFRVILNFLNWTDLWHSLGLLTLVALWVFNFVALFLLTILTFWHWNSFWSPTSSNWWHLALYRSSNTCGTMVLSCGTFLLNFSLMAFKPFFDPISSLTDGLWHSASSNPYGTVALSLRGTFPLSILVVWHLNSFWHHLPANWWSLALFRFSMARGP